MKILYKNFSKAKVDAYLTPDPDRVDIGRRD